MTNSLIIFRRVAAIAAALAWLLIIPAPALCAADIPEKYEPLKLAEKIIGTPGTVAWSPNGKLLAYIEKDIEIYDTSSAETSSVKIENSYFLSWMNDDTLMVLHGGGGLSMVDAKTREKSNLEAPANAVSVYPAWDGKRLLVFTYKSKTMRIGVDVAYGLYLLTPEDGSVTEVFASSRILPRRYEGSDQLRGWLSAGPSPVSGEALLLEFIVPPNAPEYIKAVLIDPFTGTSREALNRYREARLKAWGAWSPLGGSVALADEKGSLKVLSLAGKSPNVEPVVTGLYPSWDSSGKSIFIGGHLVDKSGAGQTSLVEDRPESAAFFSPDGSKIALSVDGALWLLKAVAPQEGTSAVSIVEAGKKAALLRELYSEGLLDEDEYHERLYAIIGRQENPE